MSITASMTCRRGTLLEKGQELPFQQKSLYSSSLIFALLIAASWVLSFAASVYYTIIGRTAPTLPSSWAPNYLHPAAFLYSFVSFPNIRTRNAANICILQLCWLRHMVSSSVNYTQVTSLSSHIVVNNLLYIAFVLLSLWYDFEEVEIISNCAFVNILVLYLRCNEYSRYIELGSISGSLSWAFISFYWSWPYMFPRTDSIVRLGVLPLGWIAICGGVFHTISNKDHLTGLVLSCLAAAVGGYLLGMHSDVSHWLPSILMAYVSYGNLKTMISSNSDEAVALKNGDKPGEKQSSDIMAIYGTVDAVEEST